MKRKSKERDRHLAAPAEANRDKHINFVALESGDPDPANQAPTSRNEKDIKNRHRPGNKDKGK